MRDARDTEGVLDARSAAESLDKVVAALQLQKAQLEQDLATQSNGPKFALGSRERSPHRGGRQAD